MILRFVFISNPALLALAAAGLLVGCGRSHNPVAGAPDEVDPAEAKQRLGRLLFFDENLSDPPGQACATCHDPEAAFTDPRGGPTSRGALPDASGGRNTPSAMYAAFVPPLHYSTDDASFIGGLFWDGRVDSLEAQAQKPLLNPVEMHDADAATVVGKLRAASYADLFRRVFGAGALDDVDGAFGDAAQAIAAFERTPALAPFSSKYDAYLAGRATLTAAEARGLLSFNDEHKGNCAACHPSTPGDDGTPPLFTDFSYDNLGIPRNDRIAAAAGTIDRGLGAIVGDAAQDGKFRVPTLRNVALTAPYGHNGWFADLRSVVDFYNTRDTRPWPPAEVPATMNTEELGHLGLSDAEVEDLVAFLRTLTDGYSP